MSGTDQETRVVDESIPSVKSLSSAFESKKVTESKATKTTNSESQGPAVGIAELKNRFSQAPNKSDRSEAQKVEDFSTSQSVKNLKELWQKNEKTTTSNFSSTLKKEPSPSRQRPVKVVNYDTAPADSNKAIESFEKPSGSARDLISQFSGAKSDNNPRASTAAAAEVSISAKEKIKLFASNQASNVESKKQKVDSSEVISAKEKIKLFAEDKAASNEKTKQNAAPVSENEKGKSKDIAKNFAENKPASPAKPAVEQPVIGDVPNTKERIKQFVSNAQSSSELKPEPKEEVRVELGTKERIKQLTSNQSDTFKKEKEISDLPKPRESITKGMIKQFASLTEKESQEPIRINPAILKLRSSESGNNYVKEEETVPTNEKNENAPKIEEKTEEELPQRNHVEASQEDLDKPKAEFSKENDGVKEEEKPKEDENQPKAELPKENDQAKEDEKPKQEEETTTSQAEDNASSNANESSDNAPAEGSESPQRVSDLKEKMANVPIMGIAKLPPRRSNASTDCTGELYHPQLERPVIPSSAGRRPSETLKRTM